LARAYNTIVPPSGKVLSGGVDSNALQRPKRFFGAAHWSARADGRKRHAQERNSTAHPRDPGFGKLEA
jgi:hypothetical protein